eukprot:g41676.t1
MDMVEHGYTSTMSITLECSTMSITLECIVGVRSGAVVNKESRQRCLHLYYDQASKTLHSHFLIRMPGQGGAQSTASGQDHNLLAASSVQLVNKLLALANTTTTQSTAAAATVTHLVLEGFDLNALGGLRLPAGSENTQIKSIGLDACFGEFRTFPDSEVWTGMAKLCGRIDGKSYKADLQQSVLETETKQEEQDKDEEDQEERLREQDAWLSQVEVMRVDDVCFGRPPSSPGEVWSSLRLTKDVLPTTHWAQHLSPAAAVVTLLALRHAVSSLTFQAVAKSADPRASIDQPADKEKEKEMGEVEANATEPELEIQVLGLVKAMLGDSLKNLDPASNSSSNKSTDSTAVPSAPPLLNDKNSQSIQEVESSTDFISLWAEDVTLFQIQAGNRGHGAVRRISCLSGLAAAADSRAGREGEPSEQRWEQRGGRGGDACGRPIPARRPLLLPPAAPLLSSKTSFGASSFGGLEAFSLRAMCHKRAAVCWPLLQTLWAKNVLEPSVAIFAGAEAYRSRTEAELFQVIYHCMTQRNRGVGYKTRRSFSYETLEKKEEEGQGRHKGVVTVTVRKKKGTRPGFSPTHVKYQKMGKKKKQQTQRIKKTAMTKALQDDSLLMSKNGGLDEMLEWEEEGEWEEIWSDDPPVKASPQSPAVLPRHLSSPLNNSEPMVEVDKDKKSEDALVPAEPLVSTFALSVLMDMLRKDRTLTRLSLGPLAAQSRELAEFLAQEWKKRFETPKAKVWREVNRLGTFIVQKEVFKPSFSLHDHHLPLLTTMILAVGPPQASEQVEAPGLESTDMEEIEIATEAPPDYEYAQKASKSATKSKPQQAKGGGGTLKSVLGSGHTDDVLQKLRKMDEPYLTRQQQEQRSDPSKRRNIVNRLRELDFSEQDLLTDPAADLAVLFRPVAFRSIQLRLTTPTRLTHNMLPRACVYDKASTRRTPRLSKDAESALVDVATDKAAPIKISYGLYGARSRARLMQHDVEMAARPGREWLTFLVEFFQFVAFPFILQVPWKTDVNTLGDWLLKTLPKFQLSFPGHYSFYVMFSLSTLTSVLFLMAYTPILPWLLPSHMRQAATLEKRGLMLGEFFAPRTPVFAALLSIICQFCSSFLIIPTTRYLISPWDCTEVAGALLLDASLPKLDSSNICVDVDLTDLSGNWDDLTAPLVCWQDPTHIALFLSSFLVLPFLYVIFLLKRSDYLGWENFEYDRPFGQAPASGSISSRFYAASVFTVQPSSPSPMFVFVAQILLVVCTSLFTSRIAFLLSLYLTTVLLLLAAHLRWPTYLAHKKPKQPVRPSCCNWRAWQANLDINRLKSVLYVGVAWTDVMALVVYKEGCGPQAEELTLVYFISIVPICCLAWLVLYLYQTKCSRQALGGEGEADVNAAKADGALSAIQVQQSASNNPYSGGEYGGYVEATAVSGKLSPGADPISPSQTKRSVIEQPDAPPTVGLSLLSQNSLSLPSREGSDPYNSQQALVSQPSSEGDGGSDGKNNANSLLQEGGDGSSSHLPMCRCASFRQLIFLLVIAAALSSLIWQAVLCTGIIWCGWSIPAAAVPLLALLLPLFFTYQERSIFEVLSRNDSDAIERYLDLTNQDLDLPNASGFTPLLWAIKQKFHNAVGPLLKAGASPSVFAPGTALAPLGLAATTGQLDVVRAFQRHGVVKVLDIADRTGWSALDLACRAGQAGVVRVFLEESYRGESVALSETCLYNAVVGGSVAAVRLVLEHKADVNATPCPYPEPFFSVPARGTQPALEHSQPPALLVACLLDNLEAVNVLLEHKADVELQDQGGHSAVHAAYALARPHPPSDHDTQSNQSSTTDEKESKQETVGGQPAGHTMAGRALLEALVKAGAKLNAQNRWRQTPLMLAAKQGGKEGAAALLALKADHISQDNEGLTALMWACVSREPELVKLLLAHDGRYLHWGKAAGVIRQQAYTAIHFAAANQGAASVKELLKVGAQVNATAHNGVTPLMLAVKNGDTEVVSILLDAKADLAIANKNGTTALHYAVLSGFANLVELLLASGANDSARSSSAYFGLLYAAQAGSEDMVRAFLKRNPSRADQACALAAAAQKGHTAVMKLLLDGGLPPDEFSNAAGLNWSNKLHHDNTALHWAVSADQLGAVKLLVDSKADVNKPNAEGVRPIFKAPRVKSMWMEKPGGEDNVLQYLLTHGAKSNTKMRQRVDGRIGEGAKKLEGLLQHSSAVTKAKGNLARLAMAEAGFLGKDDI